MSAGRAVALAAARGAHAAEEQRELVGVDVGVKRDGLHPGRVDVLYPAAPAADEVVVVLSGVRVVAHGAAVDAHLAEEPGGLSTTSKEKLDLDLDRLST